MQVDSHMIDGCFLILLGGGKGSNKRISFTNPYPQNKKFVLSNNRNDLLQFKESHLDMKAKEMRVIALRYDNHNFMIEGAILI